MNNADFWLNKINALLHDPPSKPLDITGHEAKAKQLAKILGIEMMKGKYQEADWIASAADRLNFPSYQSIGGANFLKKPYLSHPLSKQLLDLRRGGSLPTTIDDNQLQNAIKMALESIPKNIKQDPQKLFLWLWRNWSATIQQTEGNQLGFLWDLLPADTRIPDHSIWIHQALTSAIAGTNSQPAFLLLTISPVQSFINSARRTQDLWAGSYLLSYLNWAGIETIAETIGPDAVIFPNLLGQPLCDRWLYDQGILTKSPEFDDLILPSLPNRFLAIVPAETAKELAQQATENIRKKWREITNVVRLGIENRQNYNWSETWSKQTENLWEIYWQVYPWRPTGTEPIQSKNFQKFIQPHKPYLGQDRLAEIQQILEIYAKEDSQGGGQYQPNIGAIYSQLYHITEKALGSRKSLRNFPQVDETGEKSTLGGQRAAIYQGIDQQQHLTDNSDNIGRPAIRKFWQNLSQNLGGNQISPQGNERLDAVELTKRLAWQFYFSKQPSFQSHSTDESLIFPSTHSVATASFKQAVLAKVSQSGPDSDKLRNALQTWLKLIMAKPVVHDNKVNPKIIPYLYHQFKLDKFLSDFLIIDGRLLHEETYDNEDDFAKNVTDQHRQEAWQLLRQFLKVAQEVGIPKPRKYYAILMMDGDNMGQWLSGDKMPQYKQVLHPDTKQALERQGDWLKILENRRLMSPAIHGFISKALGDFSLKLVRYIVEYRYPGKLVYAGGDDVLALVPLDCVLAVARELRAAFSGHILTNNQWEVSWTEPRAQTGYIRCQLPGQNQSQLLATMGPEATASTGIAIAHVLTPLDLVLQEARNAEKDAKNQQHRDAFSITFLKRSGEIMKAGAKWTYGNKSMDTLGILKEFQSLFANDCISSKFPYILREEAEILQGLPHEIYRSEIKRLLKRQQGGKNLSKEQRKALEKDLENLGLKLTDLINHADQETALTTFADLLVFTRFLATSEGEN